MAQQSARRGRKNQMYSSCLEHAFMIWFRSANSHTGPQLHRCIRGRTDGSIRLRANLLQKSPPEGPQTSNHIVINVSGFSNGFDAFLMACACPNRILATSDLRLSVTLSEAEKSSASRPSVCTTTSKATQHTESTSFRISFRGYHPSCRPKSFRLHGITSEDDFGF